MGTRTVITFKDRFDEFSVYQHWDGYPSTVIPQINAALSGSNTWPLPRFEADEAAAGYIACHKSGPGDIRMTTGRDSHRDLSYAYVVGQFEDDNRPILIDVFLAGGGEEDYDLIWSGSLADALKEAETM